MTVQALLLHFESTPIVDSGPFNIAIAAANEAHTSTANPKVGAQSMVCNGSAYILAHDPRLIVGAQDFSFGIWAYFTVIPSPYSFILDTREGSGSASGFNLVVFADASLVWSDGVTSHGTGAGAIHINTWYLVELKRVNGIVTLYLNGAVVISNAAENNFSSQTVLVAAANFFPVGANPMFGNLDEMSFVIGASPHNIVGSIYTGLNNFTRLVKA